MNKAEAQIKEIIKRTLVIDNPQSIDEFTMPRIMEIVNKEIREAAVKWRTESVISDKDSYYEILEESYKLYDDWKSKQEEKP